jgi:hypothetical protein
METTMSELDVEQGQIRARIEQLQTELQTLRARLQELARLREQRLRGLHSYLQIVAAPQAVRHEIVPKKIISKAEPRPPVEPVEQLRQLTRGTGLFAPAEGASCQGEVVLLIRGESHRLAALREALDLQFRAGLLSQPEAGVAILPVVVRLGPGEEPDNLYETWINQSPMGLQETLKALATQERLVVYLHGNDCRLEQTLEVPNPLQAFAQETLPLVGTARSLSGDEWHQVRAAVHRQYPTVRALWRALQS